MSKNKINTNNRITGGSSVASAVLERPSAPVAKAPVAKPNPTDGITMNFTDDSGVQVVRETKREVITSGAWATLMFQYQNLDKSTGEWGKTATTIRRYQKREGEYRIKSKFNISSDEQAHVVIGVLSKWCGKPEVKA